MSEKHAWLDRRAVAAASHAYMGTPPKTGSVSAKLELQALVVLILQTVFAGLLWCPALAFIACVVVIVWDLDVWGRAASQCSCAGCRSELAVQCATKVAGQTSSTTPNRSHPEQVRASAA